MLYNKEYYKIMEAVKRIHEKRSKGLYAVTCLWCNETKEVTWNEISYVFSEMVKEHQHGAEEFRINYVVMSKI